MSVTSLDETVPRHRLTAPERRSSIMRAAVEVFATRGYSAPGIGEIAAEAGVTRAVIYDHFASKRDLYLEVLHEQSARFVGHVGAHIVGDALPGIRMRATIDAVFSFAERNPLEWALMYTNDAQGDAEANTAWQAAWQSRSDAVSEMLARDLAAVALEAGTARASLVVEMLIGALGAGAGKWRREFPAVPRDEVVELATKLLWPGMASFGS
jgi:AcrR family transcriptional regulator